MSDTNEPESYRLLDAIFVVEQYRAFVKGSIEADGVVRYFAVPVDLNSAQSIREQLKTLGATPIEPQKEP